VWDANTGRQQFTVPDAWNPSDLAFTPDGKAVAVATHAGAVVLLDAKTGRPVGR
jgi:DNA-binding beta-propeller fold protein YncE